MTALGIRVSRWISCICFIVSLMVTTAYAEESQATPNFIIIIGDDVGWNDIGAYGNPYIRKPNVDGMANAGLKFNYAFLTTSSCSPSRASIMTGRYPHATGAGELHQPLSMEAVTIAAILKDSGYYTACAGKFHMGNIKSHFDTVTTSRPSGCETWVDTLKNRPKEKPFFLWLAAFDSHRDWSATKGKHAIATPHKNGEFVIPSYLADTTTVRRDFAEYYDEVSRLDDYTGKVIAELKRQDVLDNTVIIFMSDNGRPFPRAKTTLYDDGI
jgi:N-sulfoglucosamine sulfohydrolase